MCKFDIEKAYDHINWPFILRVLKGIQNWKQMDRLNPSVYLHYFLLNLGELQLGWVLQHLQRLKARGSLVLFPFCCKNGGALHSLRKGKQRRFSLWLLHKRKGGRVFQAILFIICGRHFGFLQSFREANTLFELDSLLFETLYGLRANLKKSFYFSDW